MLVKHVPSLRGSITMMLVIAIESILFGLMGYAILQVSRKMPKDYDRTAILWIMSFVMAAQGARLLRDLIVDGVHVEVGTFGGAAAGAATMFGTLFGVVCYVFMLVYLVEPSTDSEDAEAINA